MSSSEDSETAEWEREQMLRGTQSRARQQRQRGGQLDHQESKSSTTEANPERIDAIAAKNLVNQDIEKLQEEIESLNRNIGATKLNIIKSENRIKGIKRQVESLEASNPLFQSLANMTSADEVYAFLNDNRQQLEKLPHDQREMIGLLDRKIRGILDSVIDEDQSR